MHTKWAIRDIDILECYIYLYILSQQSQKSAGGYWAPVSKSLAENKWNENLSCFLIANKKYIDCYLK